MTRQWRDLRSASADSSSKEASVNPAAASGKLTFSVNDYFKRFYPPDWKTAEYEFTTMLGGMSRLPGRDNIFPRVLCADGVSLSVQGHYGAYSDPRDDFAEHYSEVEVGFIEDSQGRTFVPPESWRSHTDGDSFPNQVYAWVPVQLVEEFVIAHGGISPDAAASQSNVETPVKHEEAPGT